MVQTEVALARPLSACIIDDNVSAEFLFERVHFFTITLKVEDGALTHSEVDNALVFLVDENVLGQDVLGHDVTQDLVTKHHGMA